MTDLNVWEKYVALQKRIGNIIVDKKAGNIIYNNGVVCLTYSTSYPINKSTIVKYEFNRGDGKEYKSSYSAFLREFKNIFSPNDEIENTYAKVFNETTSDQSTLLLEKMRDELLTSFTPPLNKDTMHESTDVDFDLAIRDFSQDNDESVILNSQPLFIAVDGGDGVGKTTVCRYIGQLLLEVNKSPVCTLGHAHGEFGQLVRSTILNNLTANTSHTTQLLLFMANRRHIYEKVVKPALNKGKIAIVDRWHLTSYAYQCDAVNFDTLVMATTEDCIPDINFVLLADRNVSERRLNSRDESTDHLEKRAVEGADQLNAKFREGALSDKYAKRTFIIDANQSIDEVNHQVKTILSMYISGIN